MGGGSVKRWRLVCLDGLVAVAAALSATLPGVALLLAPAMVLFAALLLSFTPGEQLLDRLRAPRFARQIQRAPRSLAVRRLVVVRKLASLASSGLAMRPPRIAPALIS